MRVEGEGGAAWGGGAGGVRRGVPRPRPSGSLMDVTIRRSQTLTNNSNLYPSLSLIFISALHFTNTRLRELRNVKFKLIVSNKYIFFV